MITTTKTRMTGRAMLILGLATLLAGCSRDGGQAGGGFTPPPTPVEAAVVAIEGVTDRFITVGSLEAGEAITVMGEIDGVLRELPFREGGRLAEGDLIARLDDAQLSAEAQRARALRDQYKASYDRVKSVVDQGAGTPQDLDDALATLKVAEANLALAETRLAKTRITAPFDGLAGKRKVSRGAFLRAGTPITSLAQIERLRVAFAVPERILSSLEVGARVLVSTTAFPGEVLTGTIDVIEPQLDPLTRSVNVIALVDNPDELMRPGMSATIEVVMQQRSEALTLPSEAVFVEGGQAYVYVIKPDSLVSRTPVSLGTRLAGVVEVTEGVNEGDSVVKAGHQKLYEGAKVMPLTAPAQEGADQATDGQKGDTP
jgi:membrane fusion protein (multidrug efflux system)